MKPANRDAPLVAKEPLSGAYILLTFRHPEVAQQARAGQFVMIKAGTSSEPPLRRPFSILDVDASLGTFRLFLKTVGAGSRALADLRLGEVAQCLGPLGVPFPAPPADREAVLVAGGYGIAPFHLFCRELGRAGRGARVFYGGRTAGDLQIREAFDALGVPLVAATDDGSLGHRGSGGRRRCVRHRTPAPRGRRGRAPCRRDGRARSRSRRPRAVPHDRRPEP